jgi:hypothetical protein
MAEVVKNDLRELKVRRWRQKASNIKECTRVIEEAQVVKEPQSQGVI